MKITLFVHECRMEVGHSNAMIETLRNLPADGIERLDIVSFVCDDVNKLFPDLKGRVYFHKVPFFGLYPFLIKMAFYHFWSLFYLLFFSSKDTIKISIGIASIWADIVNVQFIHAQWEKVYFNLQKMSVHTWIYKKILFFYFTNCEKYLFARKNIQFVALSKFIAKYLIENFKISSDRVRIIYSGVNLNKFHPGDIKRDQLFDELKIKYPTLSKIDIDRPIALFIGAFERKGLGDALNSMSNIDQAQMIVVGKAESKSKFKFPQTINVAHISHTDEIASFYALCDVFIFPTYYEPFGLVITEAVANGLIVYTTEHDVGASEIIKDLPEVHLYKSPTDIKINNLRILSLEEKVDLRNQRLSRLEQYSWKRAGNDFYQVLINS